MRILLILLLLLLSQAQPLTATTSIVDVGSSSKVVFSVRYIVSGPDVPVTTTLLGYLIIRSAPGCSIIAPEAAPMVVNQRIICPKPTDILFAVPWDVRGDIEMTSTAGSDTVQTTVFVPPQARLPLILR